MPTFSCQQNDKPVTKLPIHISIKYGVKYPSPVTIRVMNNQHVQTLTTSEQSYNHSHTADPAWHRKISSKSVSSFFAKTSFPYICPGNLVADIISILTSRKANYLPSSRPVVRVCRKLTHTHMHTCAYMYTLFFITFLSSLSEPCGCPQISPPFPFALYNEYRRCR